MNSVNPVWKIKVNFEAKQAVLGTRKQLKLNEKSFLKCLNISFSVNTHSLELTLGLVLATNEK